MRDFEAKRREIFERIARRSLERIEPENALMAAPEIKQPTAPHSRLPGGDLRATAYAATALAVTGSFDLAWKSLASVLDRQDMDPQSLTYGNFFWNAEWKSCLDPNIVSFIAPFLCYLLRHWGRRMPEDLRQRLRRALALSVTGLNAHRATWGYTNIALLNIACKLSIGNVLDDPRARKLAYWDWEEWRNHTAQLGTIVEFNSPPYTGVQINALAMMLDCNAEPSFLKEVRAAMRHLIGATVIDYHPGIGRITGPNSRAYPGNRRLRGYASELETVLHFVLDTPEPEGGCHPWIGVPIGPDDIPEAARNPVLPRTTRAATHGCSRVNYLCRDFALGHVSGRGRWASPVTPYFLAYPARSRRCTMPFLPVPLYAEGHFAAQREGRMLAATLWLIDRSGACGADSDCGGMLSGLRTGRPDNLLRDPAIRPGFDVELGLRGQIRILDGAGREIADESRPFEHPALVVETESVCVGLRFTGSGELEPELSLHAEPDGEMVLRIRSSRNGWVLNTLEEACFCAFMLDVRPRERVKSADEMARAMRRATIRTAKAAGEWRLEADDGGSGALALSIPVEPAWMYSIDDRAITPNLWVHGQPPDRSLEVPRADEHLP